MTLIASRPADPQVGRHVSGMVQCVAYSFAALGPLAVGGLAGLTRRLAGTHRGDAGLRSDYGGGRAASGFG